MDPPVHAGGFFLSPNCGPREIPAEPLVSYQINRQLSGWNLPPPMIRAFGAHCQYPTLDVWFEMKAAAN